MVTETYNFISTEAWKVFVSTYDLTAVQQNQFQKYAQLLVQENEKYNITAITTPTEIVADHFYDSLALVKLHDMKTAKSIVDVGSGGGFPGIPMAIMCPDSLLHLVEVNLKKVHFLKLVAQELGLTNIMIHTDDWRTFLRKFTLPVDIFIARASLPVEELLRIFKPSSRYQKSIFVYWASKKWVPTLSEKEYLDNCLPYVVGEKQRQLCFFKLKKTELV